MKSGSSQSQPTAPQSAVPQWQQQYNNLQTAKTQPQESTSPDQLMQMLGMNQQSPSLQGYMQMMGGGGFGGIIPQGQQAKPVFRPPAQPMMEQKNPTTFGQSPWPGVWGGV